MNNCESSKFKTFLFYIVFIQFILVSPNSAGVGLKRMLKKAQANVTLKTNDLKAITEKSSKEVSRFTKNIEKEKVEEINSLRKKISESKAEINSLNNKNSLLINSNQQLLQIQDLRKDLINSASMLKELQLNLSTERKLFKAEKELFESQKVLFEIENKLLNKDIYKWILSFIISLLTTVITAIVAYFQVKKTRAEISKLKRDSELVVMTNNDSAEIRS